VVLTGNGSLPLIYWQFPHVFDGFDLTGALQNTVNSRKANFIASSRRQPAIM
jgi:hypothetical protein